MDEQFKGELRNAIQSCRQSAQKKLGLKTFIALTKTESVFYSITEYPFDPSDINFTVKCNVVEDMEQDIQNVFNQAEMEYQKLFKINSESTSSLARDRVYMCMYAQTEYGIEAVSSKLIF